MICNVFFMQNRVYFILGQLASMSFVQGGCGFQVLCPSVYRYLCGMSAAEIIVSVEEVSNPETLQLIEKVLFKKGIKPCVYIHFAFI